MSEPTVLRPPGPGVPLPVPTDVSRPFWEGCARDELRFQRCHSCRRAIFIPETQCRHCGSTDIGWERSGGRGQVYSWSVVWRPQAPAFDVPYVCVVVALEEGHKMLANLIGCTPDDVHEGMGVEVEFHHAGDGVKLPYFRPAS